MYTFAAGSVERRAGQTAMYLIADGLTRLLAPILSFTADELWRYLPGAREESVHTAVFPSPAELDTLADRDGLDRWTRLIALREQVLAEIEPLRKDKRIGSSLQAKVILSVPADELAFLQTQSRELPTLFIVSDVELRPSGSDQRSVVIERAGGVKCERCWRYVPSVSTDPAWAGLCDRCQDALAAHV
jgi:isoleucyl-tRNA synthetase